MHIEPITIADFFAHPDAPALLEAYARECANEGLPPYRPHREAYATIEANGALRVLAAFDDKGRMLGFLALLMSLNPHYSVLLAVTESWFVGPDHRATGAGLALYRAAKDAARARRAAAIYVSAPKGGQLAGVMEGLGATETNRVFCEVLA